MRTYEYKARPNKEQKAKLRAVLMASRRLYNDCLQELVEHYKATGKHMNLFEQDKRHGAKEHPNLPAIVVDTTLKRLHRSFANFFRGRKESQRIGFPLGRTFACIAGMWPTEIRTRQRTYSNKD